MKFNYDFINVAENVLNKHYNNKYQTRKHREIIYMMAIIECCYTTPYWSRYKYGNICGKYLNKKQLEYVKKGIYEEIYKIIIQKYILTQNNNIQYLVTDTSFISNRMGYNLPRNKFYKSKKGVKLSTIVDQNGIPLSILVKNGNINDAIILEDTYDKLNYKKCKSINKRRSSYFLADKGYDSNAIRLFLSKKGHIVLIPYNRRNNKGPFERPFSNKHKIIYKKRIIVENYFAWLKQYPKLNQMNERNINSYENIVKLISSYKISMFIEKTKQ